MTTSKNRYSKIKTLVATSAGLFVSFDRDIGDLKAETPIALGFPTKNSGKNYPPRNKTTEQLCVDIVCNEFTDEQISVMVIAGTSDIDGYETKDVKTTLSHIDKGKTVTYPAWFTIVKIKDKYMPVEVDYDHEKKTGNKRYVLDREIRNVRNNDELKAIFYAA